MNLSKNKSYHFHQNLFQINRRDSRFLDFRFEISSKIESDRFNLQSTLYWSSVLIYIFEKINIFKKTPF